MVALARAVGERETGEVENFNWLSQTNVPSGFAGL
jgi:hypothetical protein